MSTDGNLPDLKFPQSGGQGNSIHLSANTLKQHGRNGKKSDLLNLLLLLPYCRFEVQSWLVRAFAWCFIIQGYDKFKRKVSTLLQ